MVFKVKSKRAFFESTLFLILLSALVSSLSVEAADLLQGERVQSGLILEYDFSEGQGDKVHDTSGFESALDLAIPDTNKVEWLSCGGLRIA